MKAILVNWVEPLLEQHGYKTNQEIPIEDLFMVAEELFAKGLNVMIFHGAKDSGYQYLCVDNQKFRQR